MKTVAILSQKGGTGKTTLAINLAVEAARRTGSFVSLIDLDPQASAASWGDSRGQANPQVISCQASRLGHHLEQFKKEGSVLSIIDTAPHSETASLAAARAADLVLVPLRPAIFDLRAIAMTVDLIGVAKVPAYAVLNAVPPRGGLANEAAEAVLEYGLAMVPVRITQRSALVHSLTHGQAISEYEPSGKGNAEFLKLFDWLDSILGVGRDNQGKTKSLG
jgi:chromosome partitioning protein